MSITEQQGINIVQLLAVNNVIANCSNLPRATRSTLCIPTAAVCKLYVVKAGDTFTNIANSSKAS
ncbi:hypothetical protein CGMCC3_g9046 [Colletotrichum fructicola]|nr:uncharacterized protein CGMCC3_g9046 [Colletotrichum fructicola]KAE9574827.1 hypothetical protein CGMCC3_g9046 [Colletotrichum fructicola]